MYNISNIKKFYLMFLSLPQMKSILQKIRKCTGGIPLKLRCTSGQYIMIQSLYGFLRKFRFGFPIESSFYQIFQFFFPLRISVIESKYFFPFVRYRLIFSVSQSLYQIFFSKACTKQITVILPSVLDTDRNFRQDLLYFVDHIRRIQSFTIVSRFTKCQIQMSRWFCQIKIQVELLHIDVFSYRRCQFKFFPGKEKPFRIRKNTAMTSALWNIIVIHSEEEKIFDIRKTGTDHITHDNLINSRRDQSDTSLTKSGIYDFFKFTKIHFFVT